MTFSSDAALLYPTPFMQGLFPSLSVELDYLEVLVGTESLSSDVLKHGETIATLRGLLAANNSALALFLAHPTQWI